MKGINLNTILLIAIAVFITLQLKSCFSKSHKPEQMVRNEERIKYLEQERIKDSINYVEVMAMYDSLIVISKQKSIILSTQYTSIKKRLNEIPIIIGNLNNEDLRRAVWEFK
jgi:hypothetical protein